jgi:hypothetical protein
MTFRNRSSTPRELPDWLTEFQNHAKWGEAPPHFYFWVGVATIAAAMRRKTWLDMGTFIWYPNLYTVLVAPPGIIQKSSTSDLGMRLLKKIPAIHQGPTTLTWQSLYDAYLAVGEEFQISETETKSQYALYINSSELGITLNMKDVDMINQLIHMWDGAELKKRTRLDGELLIETPSLNLIACTTPSWIAENVPQYLIGGGLTSRMLFVYGETKHQYVAYPKRKLPPDYLERQDRLIRDLERISQLVGNFSLTEEAYAWGEAWYKNFFEHEAPKLDKTLIGGYIARKQTLVHKVAMVLTASQGDELVITLPTLERAVKLITQLETHMPMVYSRIGMSHDANSSEQVLAFLDRYGGKVDFNVLYRYMHRKYPDPEVFQDVLVGMVEAGYITIDRANRMVIKL